VRPKASAAGLVCRTD